MKTAPPYTARRCPVCGEWVYCADGPFAEGDPTKTVADWNHWEARHLDPATDTGPGSAVGFPFFDWNDEPVDIEEPRSKFAPDCDATIEVWGPHPGCREFMTEPECFPCSAPATAAVTVEEVVYDDEAGEMASERTTYLRCAEHLPSNDMFTTVVASSDRFFDPGDGIWRMVADGAPVDGGPSPES